MNTAEANKYRFANFAQPFRVKAFKFAWTQTQQNELQRTETIPPRGLVRVVFFLQDKAVDIIRILHTLIIQLPVYRCQPYWHIAIYGRRNICIATLGLHTFRAPHTYWCCGTAHILPAPYILVPWDCTHIALSIFTGAVWVMTYCTTNTYWGPIGENILTGRYTYWGRVGGNTWPGANIFAG